jgi:hypothetical protein
MQKIVKQQHFDDLAEERREIMRDRLREEIDRETEIRLLLSNYQEVEYVEKHGERPGGFCGPRAAVFMPGLRKAEVVPEPEDRESGV